MQRQLIPPQPYSPLPNQPGAYVPVLQDHSGERMALSSSSPQAWSRMTPLIEVVARGGALSHEAMKGRIRALQRVCGEHPIYLDIKKLDPCTPTQTSKGERPAMEILYELARSRDLPFMPVAWTHSNDCHLDVVASTSEIDGHGMALRHRVGKTVLQSGASLEELLADRLNSLRIPVSEVDLFIDLEYLDPDSDQSTRWILGMLEDCRRVGPWRSVVLIATSVPSSFGSEVVPEHSTREIPRHEWSLWKKVADQVNTPLGYGDYGVQNPIPPPKPPPIAPWANIRYSLEEALLVARGFQIGTRGPEQYSELSSWITSHPSFRGGDFSFGDAEIQRWSTQCPIGVEDEEDNNDEGEAKLGGLSYWRGVGMSHHLELITNQLRAYLQ